MAQEMGLRIKGQPVAEPSAADVAANGNGQTGERPKWVRDVPIKSYTPSKQHSGLADYIINLVQDPGLLAEFNRNPELASQIYADMTEDERKALLSRHPGRIRMALKAPEHPELDELDKLHGPVQVSAN